MRIHSFIFHRLFLTSSEFISTVYSDLWRVSCSSSYILPFYFRYLLTALYCYNVQLHACVLYGAISICVDLRGCYILRLRWFLNIFSDWLCSYPGSTSLETLYWYRYTSFYSNFIWSVKIGLDYLNHSSCNNSLITLSFKWSRLPKVQRTRNMSTFILI